MSENTAQRYSKAAGVSYSIAGKVFVLGEYAVLGALPAVVASLGPRFELRPCGTGPAEVFHPESPAGRFLNSVARDEKRVFEFFDPFSGNGGFGASTAQFALLYAALHGVNDSWQSVWRKYRDLTAESPVPPSGADLVAQWHGGVIRFQGDLVCEDLWDAFDWSKLLVFTATAQSGRKVITHEHLQTLARRSLFQENSSFLLQLMTPLTGGIEAIRENDAVKLGSAMSSYAAVLNQAGLESKAATQDREALGQIPGVLGVKGAGALLADAVLVLASKPVHPEIIAIAKARGLHLASAGLNREPGILATHEELP